MSLELVWQFGRSRRSAAAVMLVDRCGVASSVKGSGVVRRLLVAATAAALATAGVIFVLGESEAGTALSGSTFSGASCRWRVEKRPGIATGLAVVGPRNVWVMEGGPNHSLVLERASLPGAAAVARLHEALCFLRAYPDSREVETRATRMLESFARRGDLRRAAENQEHHRDTAGGCQHHRQHRDEEVHPVGEPDFRVLHEVLTQQRKIAAHLSLRGW